MSDDSAQKLYARAIARLRKLTGSCDARRLRPQASPLTTQRQARVIACDATSARRLYRARSHASAGCRPSDRGLGRLRLLLGLLEASEIDVRIKSDATMAAGTRRRRLRAPAARPISKCSTTWARGASGLSSGRETGCCGREVALKMPLPERLLSLTTSHRFLHEARAAARLDHPNIVRVFEAGELGPLGYYIASEFCAGPTLRDWLKCAE